MAAQKFKSLYRISSRRITKFVTYRQERDVEDIDNKAVELLLDFKDNVKAKYDSTEVFNTDQSEFSYIVHTRRTLSHTGERQTHVAVNALSPLTRSPQL